MGFLDSVKSMFSAGGTRDETGYWIYVRCSRCGEAIGTRINLRNDLSPRDGGGYVVSKTLVGSQRCFERVGANLIFDENRRLVERQVSGGDFITAEDFEAADNS